MKKISILFLFVLTILNGGKSFGQDLGPSIYTKEASVNLMTTGSSTSVINFTFDKSSHFPGYLNKTVKYARTYIEVAPIVMPLTTGSSAVTGTMTVAGRNTGGTNETLYDNISNPQTQNYSININNANPSAVVYNDLTTQFVNNAALTGLYMSFTYSNSFSSAVDMIRVKVKLEVAYNLKVDEPSVNFALTTPAKPVVNLYAPRVATFSWNTGGRYYPAYQLQVLRLYNKTSGVALNACSTTVDWSNAITINIENDLKSTLTPGGMVSYDYTIAEGTGLYIWRVRAIGNFYPGGFANNSNYSALWSSSIAEGTAVGFADITSGTLPDGYFYFSDPDSDKNWSYKRVFTEKTNVKESIIYADYLLRHKQTQIYLPSKRITMLSQNVIDYMGRSAITTMVIPSQHTLAGLLGYKSNFVQNQSGQLFRDIDFDSDASLLNPLNVTIKPANGFEYYHNNPNKSIPNSGGFPYSRAVFEHSTNSRIIDQSGVGKDHAIGTAHSAKTFYSTASDEELIRIFGDEAPRGDKVLKQISLDADGTASISYTDLNGKVIATCLSFTEDEVATATEPMLSYQVNETINNNVAITDGLMSSKRISFSTATDLVINYSIPCDGLVKLCGIAEEAVCKYKLFVTIHDVTNPNNRLVAEKVIDMSSCPSMPIDFLASDFKYAAQPGTPTATSLTMQPGDYIIEKRLVFDNTGSDALKNKALSSIRARFESYVKQIVDELKAVATQKEYDDFVLKYSCSIVEPVCTTGTPETCTFTVTPQGPGSCTELTPAQLAAGFFSISAQPINPANLNARMLKLTSECCNIEVPIEYVPPIVCPEPPVSNTHNYHFYDFAINYFQAKGFAPPTDPVGEPRFWGEFNDQATAAAELDQMITHMIHDTYASNVSGTAKEQYTCANLSKCWMNALNAITLYDPATVEDNNTSNISDDELDFDDLFDNMPLGGVLKFFVGRKKREKMQEEVVDAGSNAASNGIAGYGPSLIDIFMNCAGYKYASVMTLGSNPFTGTACDASPAALATTRTDLASDVGTGGTYSTMSQATFKRVFQFKYVFYEAGVDRKYKCEATSCFCPSMREAACVPYILPDYADGGPCFDNNEKQYDKCDPTKDHHDWGFGARLAFKECLKNNYEEPVTTLTLPNIFPGESNTFECQDLFLPDPNGDFITIADVNRELARIENTCETNCEDHRPRFTQIVRTMFTDHCYNVVSNYCELGPNDVPEQDIALIVDQMVAQCRSMCDVSYKAARDHFCVQCESPGQPTRSYIELFLGSTRELFLVNLAKQGNVRLDIESRCAGQENDPLTCDTFTLEPHTGTGYTPACGKDYTTPVIFCQPQIFSTNPPCPLEQLDANRVTQPIKLRIEAE